MANVIRIKKRAAGGAAGAPASLKSSELAFNEQDDSFYYGKGDDGSANATSIVTIGGRGAFADLTTAQTIAGIKTFSSSPIVPAPSTDLQAATKKYVDDTVAGAGGYTDEAAQDAIGGILVDSAEIDFTYNDATPSITASIVAASIDESKLDASVNASLDLADSATQPGDLGSLAALNTVGTTQIDNSAVTYAKVQNVSATSRVLGRITAGAGVVEELTGANIRTIANVEDGADVTDAVNVGSTINGATAKTTPVSADTLALIDSAASNTLKKITYGNLSSAIVGIIVDSAPGTLDTLNELAAALGDDASFSTTITNSLALKAPLASPALTGTPTAPTASAGTNTTQVATTANVVATVAAATIDGGTF